MVSSLSFLILITCTFFLFVNLARSLSILLIISKKQLSVFFIFSFFSCFEFHGFLFILVSLCLFCLCFFSDFLKSLYLWFEIFLSLSCTLLMLYILKALFQGHTKYLIWHIIILLLFKICLVSLDIIHPMDYLEICWLISKCLEILLISFSYWFPV